jgi:hypothetical protein
LQKINSQPMSRDETVNRLLYHLIDLEVKAGSHPANHLIVLTSQYI